MAATDQTYRNQKTLHIVFGATSIAMFVTLLLMMVQDFNKEFKPIQRKFRDVEVAVNERLMLDQLPDKAEVDAKVQAIADAKKELAGERDKLRPDEKKLTADREKADTAYRMKKAEFDSKSSYVNLWTERIGKTQNKGEQDKLRRELEAKKKDVEKVGEELGQKRKELDVVEREYQEKVAGKLAGPEKKVSDAEDDLKKTTGVFDRFGKTTAQKTWGFGDTFRQLPILDSFSSPVRIQQVKLNDLTIDYGGFRDVPRFDRCMTCHLGIDRPTFDRASLEALSSDPKDLAGKLKTAHEIYKNRQDKGEDLGFDPGYIPSKPTVVKLTRGEVTQYMAHPRLDLFVDGNSPHPMQSFGCTICHAGQGSSTEFVLASHTPNDFHQEEEWTKGHDWESIHFWDFPMHPSRFLESSCVKCHHELTDLVRHGVKQEAPKLLKGFELVRENGCFGCHEISGTKGGRTVGPDLRLEPQPALESLSVSEQERVRGENPGKMRKVGPALRRIAEKTNQEWTRKWIQAPRNFREDTKMPHFYGLSNNSHEYLAENAPAQKDFPDAEIHSIAHYLFAESNKSLNATDTTRDYTIRMIRELQGKLIDPGLSDVRKKELADFCRNFGNLGLLSIPQRANEINTLLAEQKQLQDRVHELHRRADALGKQKKPDEDEIEKVNKQIVPLGERLGKLLDEIADATKSVPLTKEIMDGEGNPVDLAGLPKGDPVNGRRLFTERGCLACHANDATKQRDEANHFSPLESHANFGPNLSRLAAKLGAENAEGKIDEASKKRWLVQWVLNPNVHHPRTRMPVTFLAPNDANDVAEWLLSQTASTYDEKDPAAPSSETLTALARVYLSKAKDMTQDDVDTILPVGKARDDSKAEELLKRYLRKDADDTDATRSDADEQALRPGKFDLKWYIGKKSISRLGCYGCHDVPGFENAKPIGTALNDWGKKNPERLAFEDVGAFVKKHYHIEPLREPTKQLALRETVKRLNDKGDLSDPEKEQLKDAEKALKEMAWEGKGDQKPYDQYFYESLEHHHRDGFLNQKLVEPRSFDYERSRAWDDRLRMPQFQFARVRQQRGESDEAFAERKLVEEAAEREAVMTFILGLVAEPVPLKYVNHPAPERLNEVKGRQVLEKYNCVGCHQVQPGYYEFQRSPAVGDDPGTIGRLQKSFDRIKGGLASDHYFPNHNAWAGKPSPYPDRFALYGVNPASEENDLRIRLAEALRFTGTDGVIHDLPQSSAALVAPGDLISRDDQWGGTLAELLIGRSGRQTEERYKGEPLGYLASRYEQRFNDKADDARSALPPPLEREGERVQPRWLYQFLLNPTPVRPQNHMLLRMPRFNMSSDEAMALVNYFGSVSKLGNPDAELTFPYLKIDQRENGFWRQKSQDYVRRMEAAKELDPRLKQLEPVFKEQLQSEKTDLEAARDALKKDIDAEKDEAAKKTKQAELTTLETNLKTMSDQLSKGDFTALRDRWKREDAYATDAYRLATNKELCLKCHSIGKQEISGAIGPNLALAPDRLRPEWTLHWLANPKRMFTYDTQMPQNFPNDKLQLQESFHGSSLDQVKAVRDALMDLPRLGDLPANRSPRPARTGGDK